MCLTPTLLQLLLAISKKNLKFIRNPRTITERLANNSIALNFLKAEGIKLVNIGPEDIENCDPKLILGEFWEWFGLAPK